MAKAQGDARVEAACLRALHFGLVSYRQIASILENKLDQQPLEAELPLVLPTHDNVRGQAYFA